MTSDRWDVLVGVDGSDASLRAAEWAAADAATSGRAVTVCYVSDITTLSDVQVPRRVREEARASGRRMIDRGLVRVRQTAAAVDADGHMVEGNPTAELLHLAADAHQVVVGARGTGGFAQLVLGSVGAEVAAHAPCPVVIVRGGTHERHELVVGVDASERSDRVLEYAFDHAARHGLRVHALHVLHDHGPVPLPPLSARAWLTEDGTARARQLLADTVAPWAMKYPAVPVETTVVTGSPAAVLRDASQGAALVVVGSRGHGGFAGLMLGSVGHALVRHADCPVVVVH